MSQATTPKYVERFKDVFNADDAQQVEDPPDVDGWISADRAIILVPDDTESVGVVGLDELNTKPEGADTTDYEDNTGDEYELIELRHKQTYSEPSSGTIRHYVKREYVEQVAEVFEVEPCEVMENLESRYDRGDMYLVKYAPEESEHVVIISPHTAP